MRGVIAVQVHLPLTPTPPPQRCATNGARWKDVWPRMIYRYRTAFTTRRCRILEKKRYTVPVLHHRTCVINLLCEYQVHRMSALFDFGVGLQSYRTWRFYELHKNVVLYNFSLEPHHIACASVRTECGVKLRPPACGPTCLEFMFESPPHHIACASVCTECGVKLRPPRGPTCLGFMFERPLTISRARRSAQNVV